ncbi:MAG: DNA polymerase III subunit gamma/tau, partial [Bacteroidaceae bacterium]|nr:DNA polymerase III subunit gamma/tau [Bacteroidaceae bacterium]
NEVELTIAWREFAAALPQEDTAMSHRMHNIEPTLQEDGTTFLVIADNPSILNELEHMTPRIETFLRQRLRNGKVHMALRLREVTDKRKVYSRRETYQMLLEQSPVLRKMREAFLLELA